MQIVTALPLAFDFYEQGSLRAQEQRTDFSIETHHAIQLQWSGDLEGILVVFFPKHLPLQLDESLYAEVVNLLASQTANQLYHRYGLDILVSAPRAIETFEVEKIFKMRHHFTHRTYVHCIRSHLIYLPTLILQRSGKASQDV